MGFKTTFNPFTCNLDYYKETNLSPVEGRVTNLENNERKVQYWETVYSEPGTVTKPADSTIILDGFQAGVDALVETIEGGKPSGQSPIDALGDIVTIQSFNTSGDYTLSSTPVDANYAIIYYFKISDLNWSNVDIDQVITDEKLVEDDYVRVDGTRPLTAGWDAGAFSITANSVILGSAANTISGGATSGGNLTLQSTTHATKGKILFGSSAYGEVNDWLGIGTTNPDTYSFTSTLRNKLLTIQANGTNQTVALNVISSGTGSAIIDFGNESIRRATINATNGSDLIFYTNHTNSGTTVSERMRIKSGGDVHIAYAAVGNLIVGSDTSSNSSYGIENRRTSNESTWITSTNDNTGTIAASGFRCFAGGIIAQFLTTNPNWVSDSTAIKASSGNFSTSPSAHGGLSFIAGSTDANANIRFYTGGITDAEEKWRIDNNTGTLININGGGLALNSSSEGDGSITSTSHATKGKVTLGIVTINEASNFVGFSNTTPGTEADVFAAAAGTSGLRVNTSNSGTAITNVSGPVIINRDTTTNNWAGVLFADAAGVGASALMGVQMTNRTSHYGDYAFGTRAADGFLERLRIGVNGIVISNATFKPRTGTATAGTAPIKLTAGTNLTTPEAGAIEWDGTNVFITQSDGTRKTLAYI